MYIDKIKRPGFFEKLKLEHYVYLYFEFLKEICIDLQQKFLQNVVLILCNLKYISMIMYNYR